MPTQHHSLHIHLSKQKRKDLLDKIVGISAFLYPMSGIPQVVLVFKGETAGVSVLSWLGFMFFSTLFLLYGIVHKIKPLIVTNVLWLIVDGFVVFGTLTHHMMR